MAKKELEYKPKSCWDVLTGAAHTKAMDDVCTRYLDFLSRCKTERETVDAIVARAKAAGYKETGKGDRIVRVFRGKTVLLARRGKQPLSKGMRLIGSHADTPRLDLKQRPLYEDCAVSQMKTHYYGGIRKYQWLARPLALHGVVVRKDGEVMPVCLGEDPAEPVFTVPDLLPHLAAAQNDKSVAKAFEAEKLNIIVGHAPAPESKDATGGKDKKDAKAASRIKARVLELLHAKYGLVEEDFYSAELQAVPAGPARLVGLDGSVVGGYGQDDRICVFTSLEAMLTAKAAPHTQVALFWDKEEIGSDGSTGAKSLFFEYCLEELIELWQPAAKKREVLVNTKAVSADVQGALDPDFQDLHEKMNAAVLGNGPCFSKFTGHRGKYGANDAHAEYVAWFRALLAKAGVPWQMAELGRVDVGGGGTVAKDLAIYGMDIIDFGPALLSMHSPFELSSKADLYATMLAYRAFMES